MYVHPVQVRVPGPTILGPPRPYAQFPLPHSSRICKSKNIIYSVYVLSLLQCLCVVDKQRFDPPTAITSRGDDECKGQSCVNLIGLGDLPEQIQGYFVDKTNSRTHRFSDYSAVSLMHALIQQRPSTHGLYLLSSSVRYVVFV